MGLNGVRSGDELIKIDKTKEDIFFFVMTFWLIFVNGVIFDLRFAHHLHATTTTDRETDRRTDGQTDRQAEDRGTEAGRYICSSRTWRPYMSSQSLTLTDDKDAFTATTVAGKDSAGKEQKGRSADGMNFTYLKYDKPMTRDDEKIQ